MNLRNNGPSEQWAFGTLTSHRNLVNLKYMEVRKLLQLIGHAWYGALFETIINDYKSLIK